jgi:hypothetical protein
MRRSVRRRLDRLLAAAKEPEPAPAVTAPVQNGARIMIDHEEKLYEAFRAHHEMEDIIRYLVDGRSCAHESDEDLESRWLGAWEDFFLYGSSFAAETYFDTSAELRLPCPRSASPPRCGSRRSRISGTPGTGRMCKSASPPTSIGFSGNGRSPGTRTRTR